MAPGIYVSGLYCFFDLQGGLLLLVTFLGGLWTFLVLIRQLACAHRLEIRSEQDILPVKSRKPKSQPHPVIPNALSIVPDNGANG
jgi:hypothetical protein